MRALRAFLPTPPPSLSPDAFYSPSSPAFPPQMLPELSPGRGSDEASWKEVALTLCFIDIYIREKHKALHAEISANPKRSLEHMFMTWSRKNHSFDSVR